MPIERETSNIESENGKDRILEEYASLMDEYLIMRKKLRALEKRYPPGARDAATESEIDWLNNELHQKHLNLVAIAEKLVKSKDDVLIDIIRWDNSLEEYGLPEFSILKSADIVDTKDDHSAIQFNLGGGGMVRERKTGRATPLDKPFSEHEFGKMKSKWMEGPAERVIKEDEILLVFSIVPIIEYGEEMLKPDDYDERISRAGALAKEVGGTFFKKNNGGYHDRSAQIIGVVVPKEKIGKAAQTIYENPQKFRLGEEYYGPDFRKNILMRKVNSTLYDVVGVDDKLKELPEIEKGVTEVLKKKKIVMVDDDGGVLESFIPYLLTATEGSARFVSHWLQDEEQLVDKIIGNGAEIVLLDYHLARGLEGPDVARALQKRGFKGTIIGFSSDARADIAFKDAGAVGAINKNTASPGSSIKALAEWFQKYA